MVDSEVTVIAIECFFLHFSRMNPSFMMVQPNLVVRDEATLVTFHGGLASFPVVAPQVDHKELL